MYALTRMLHHVNTLETADTQTCGKQNKDTKRQHSKVFCSKWQYARLNKWQYTWLNSAALLRVLSGYPSATYISQISKEKRSWNVLMEEKRWTNLKGQGFFC